MNILYLAHRIPYPPNKGDKIRSFNEIRYLCAAGYSVDLICLADEPEDLQYADDLLKYCRKVFVCPIAKGRSKLWGMAGFCFGKSISVSYFYRKAVQETVNRWLETGGYDVVICFSSAMAAYIFQSVYFKLSRKGDLRTGARLIMDFCDVDSDKWLQYSHAANFLMQHVYRAENARLQSYERKIYQYFDFSILISAQEKELFLQICPEADDLVIIPNGVDASYFSPDSANPVASQDNGPVLVFTGAMDYHANVDGVCWFCDKILPIAQKQLANVRFYIVGRNPAPAVRNLASLPGVHVVGNVEDIRPWYHKADVFVVPLRMARGVQNKVLEAMAMGRAVVTTSKANGGIAAADTEHLMLADSAEEFAAVITLLLQDEVKRENLGRNARKFVIENYDWEKNMKTFDNLLI